MILKGENMSTIRRILTLLLAALTVFVSLGLSGCNKTVKDGGLVFHMTVKIKKNACDLGKNIL